MQGDRWLATVLACVAVMGAVQSVQIERASSYGLTRVLHRASGQTLAELARDGSTQMREEFAFYLELRPYVEGGTLVVPREPITLEGTSVRGLSGAELRMSDYDPMIGHEDARRLGSEASFVSTATWRAGTFEVSGPGAPGAVHVLLLDERGAAYVASIDQLVRHGIAPTGLERADLIDEVAADG